jgi:mono/diheme cytochrome c family protein
MPRNGETDTYAPQVPLAQGEAIYVVNCSHCHGPEGNGDGAMAGYLKEGPANLHSPEVQNKPSSVLLQSVTEGLNVMPAFKPYLTTEEREAVVDFIRSFSPTKTEGNSP